MSRRYVVIGAGGVGAGLAAGFVRAGIPVVLVSRGDTYEAIRDRGLRYRQGGEARTLDVDVVGSPDQVRLRRTDILVLATKSQDAPATLADWAWRPVEGGGVAAELPVLLTQNGLDAERVALRYFATVIGGVTLVAARHVVAGEIEILNAPRIGQLIVGAYPSAASAPHAVATAERISADLTRADWLSQSVPHIDRWLAWKVTVNATFALSVLDGTEAERTALRDRIVEEVRRVLATAGHTLADPAAETTYDATQAAVGAGRSGTGHRPSTWQSFARGASSEVDYLNGEIVLLARLHGVPAPYNTALQQVLGRSAARHEGPGVHTVVEVLSLAGSLGTRGGADAADIPDAADPRPGREGAVA